MIQLFRPVSVSASQLLLQVDHLAYVVIGMSRTPQQDLKAIL